MISKECGLGVFLFCVVAAGEVGGDADSSSVIRCTTPGLDTVVLSIGETSSTYAGSFRNLTKLYRQARKPGSSRTMNWFGSSVTWSIWKLRGCRYTLFRWRSACNRCLYMWDLLEQVKLFMKAAPPFLDNHHGLTKVDRQYVKLFRQE